MNILGFLFCIIFGITAALPVDENGYNYDDYERCLTVYTTTTLTEFAAISTFVYTSTVIVPADSAAVVTKFVDKPENAFSITVVNVGETKTVTVMTTSTKYKGVKTTKTSTTTITTYPNAVTSVTSTQTQVIFKKGTLTVTYPSPVLNINTSNRYTGAPTSLWLSVI